MKALKYDSVSDKTITGGLVSVEFLIMQSSYGYGYGCGYVYEYVINGHCNF